MDTHMVGGTVFYNTSSRANILAFSFQVLPYMINSDLLSLLWAFRDYICFC